MKWVALVTASCAAPTVFSTVPQVRAPMRSFTTGELVLKCAPADAEVSVDGVGQGLCSDFHVAAVKVGTRARKIEVKKSGFAPWESWLAADQTRVVMNVTLEPSGGSP